MAASENWRVPWRFGACCNYPTLRWFVTDSSQRSLRLCWWSTADSLPLVHGACAQAQEGTKVLALEVVGCWVIASCALGPLLAWAFFYPLRREDVERSNAERLAGTVKLVSLRSGLPSSSKCDSTNQNLPQAPRPTPSKGELIRFRSSRMPGSQCDAPVNLP